MAISYRGAALPSFIKVKSVNFSALPKINLMTTNVPQRAGVIYSGTTLGERFISLEVAIVKIDNRSPMVLAEELAEWLRGTDLKGFGAGELILDDNPSKLFYAIISNEVPISDLISVGEGVIDFMLAAPHSYSAALYKNNFSDPSFTVGYSGTAPFYPLVKFTLAEGVTDPRIDDVVTGDSIKLVGSFPAGTVIEIDNEGKKVKIDGALSMDKIDLSSEWLYLTKYKSNSFSVVPASAISSLEFTFREAYI
ncbi:MAG: hypothetical protein K0S71_324 [Clostridia bacterium]|jgi:predicted phage tail component-like protein|nr:hypothetical protein [Clostridia bacterium]